MFVSTGLGGFRLKIHPQKRTDKGTCEDASGLLGFSRLAKTCVLRGASRRRDLRAGVPFVFGPSP